MIVTVIIPFFNYQLHVAQAIESALDQTWPDVDLVVIDDGSTDNSPEIISDLHSKRGGFCFNPADKNRFTVFDLDSTGIRKAVKDRDRISDITDMCASMEMWRIREYITHDFLIHYIRLHIPCEKESTILLKTCAKG